VIVKGVMTPADAIQALACGVAGVYVSNHGGRVVDHSLSTIEVLSEIVEAVAGEADVVVDSGFTRGAEVCKALALGARAVGIGRLQCWGLAAGGVPGLARVLEILGEEISNTMANIGCRAVGELTPEYVRWSTPALPS
jgi:isopentenyl diphosphate isomerase/L-lactate dehydrogenase-like FMN-dependent dehydrogenase